MGLRVQGASNSGDPVTRRVADQSDAVARRDVLKRNLSERSGVRRCAFLSDPDASV